MSAGNFQFARGNLGKLLALPKYLFSVLFALFVPRVRSRWVFGSGIGVGEGALAVARTLRDEAGDAEIAWLVASDEEAALAETEGFEAVRRRGWAGYWSTLRAGRIVVTHGLGDVNRFGIFGGFIVQLWHGAPLKRLHLDSAVTTEVRGPAAARKILARMYRSGASRVDLYVAGSVTAAERLRSAFRVEPGKVRVLGDPRDDELSLQAQDPERALDARRLLLSALDANSIAHADRIVLYAPTWRDGAQDPAVPSEDEAARIAETLERIDAHLIVRPHPLGDGAYERITGTRIHLLGADRVRDLTPLLGGVDTLITDYSSTAIDYSLLGRPIVWFAPDLSQYEATRGLYEPLHVTSGGRIESTWSECLSRLEDVLVNHARRHAAIRAASELAERFHYLPEGGAAARVLAEVARLTLPERELVDPEALFFESFFGRQVSCNPLALDREVARRYPDLTRYWSVTSERQSVPEGATPLLVGGRDWFVARRLARTVIVNDWMRFGFRPRSGQTVLQTWHGTMLKRLALERPGTGLRTRLAIRRESRRWGLLLSQNPHSTKHFRTSYAYRGEVLETGYPRDDRLAAAMIGAARNPVHVASARRALGVPDGVSVLSYVPTWRDRRAAVVDDLEVSRLAAELGDDWVVIVRGHTRTHELGTYQVGEQGRVIDASRHPDIADVCLASDLLITDYSSVMFDASVARVPMLFFVPDLASYRDTERGFTFDFESNAPGPLATKRAHVVECARQVREHGSNAEWIREHRDAYAVWVRRFNPHDDGGAAARVIDALEERGALGA